MSSPRYVLGVDGGTGGIRAGLFEIATGAPVGFADTPYETRYPHPGWAEQDPRAWWAGMASSVRRVLAEARVAPADVAGLCCDTTCCTVVALDASGEPLIPCILWMDMRAASQTEAVLSTRDGALALNCGGDGPVSAEWMIPKALWLKENRPDVFADAAMICEYQDYLNLKLTGRYVASANTFAVRWHFRDGAPPTSLLNALDLAALASGPPRSSPWAPSSAASPPPPPRTSASPRASRRAGRRGRLRRDGRPRHDAARAARAHHRKQPSALGRDRRRARGARDVRGVRPRRARPRPASRGRGGADEHGERGELVQDALRRRRGVLRRHERGGGGDSDRVRGAVRAGTPPGEPHAARRRAEPRGVRGSDAEARTRARVPGHPGGRVLRDEARVRRDARRRVRAGGGGGGGRRDQVGTLDADPRRRRRVPFRRTKSPTRRRSGPPS